jgi:prevent-host-death family protein
MDEVSIEKARARLGDYVNDAQNGIPVVITRSGKPAARLVPVSADADLAARARTLRDALADEATLRRVTGETDAYRAYVHWAGRAGHLLGELADRLGPPARAIAEAHYPWCKGCGHATASAPCPRCGRPASACAECGRCPDCDGDLPGEGQSRMPAPV